MELNVDREAVKETKKAKDKLQKKTKTQEKIAVQSKPADGNAVLLTGATHARELLSMQVPLFECLKLIHNGIIHKQPKYQ